MTVAETIIEQLGGNHFVAMTGAKNFVEDGNTLRMQLPKNNSKANRFWVTLNGNDLYDVRFFRYTAPKFNKKTFVFMDEKITEVENMVDVQAENLQTIFTEVTGMYTRF